jgi:c(7)-type cytochrome triheme protein
MLTSRIRYPLIAAFALFAAAEVPVCFAAMDPAPADWPSFDYKRAPGEFKRSKYGVIDPSPDVVSLQQLPVDSYGFVDWTKAMKDGIIVPRESISGNPPRLGPEDSDAFGGDVLIRSKMKFMPDVIFPHSAHTEWLKCSTCHPRIFKKKAGATPITMSGIWNGQFCGRCHDKVAFPTRNCFKCHSAPRESSK